MARERRESHLAELSLWQPSCLAHSAGRVRRLSSRQVGPPSLWICQYTFWLPMVAMLSRRLGATGLKLPSSPCCGSFLPKGRKHIPIHGEMVTDTSRPTYDGSEGLGVDSNVPNCILGRWSSNSR